MYKSTEHNIQQMADKLFDLQRGKNDGIGVSCVRDVVEYMRRLDCSTAKAVTINEFDKIRAYPDIADYVCKVFLLDLK